MTSGGFPGGEKTQEAFQAKVRRSLACLGTRKQFRLAGTHTVREVARGNTGDHICVDRSQKPCEAKQLDPSLRNHQRALNKERDGLWSCIFRAVTLLNTTCSSQTLFPNSKFRSD